MSQYQTIEEAHNENDDNTDNYNSMDTQSDTIDTEYDENIGDAYDDLESENVHNLNFDSDVDMINDEIDNEMSINKICYNLKQTLLPQLQ